MQGVFQSVIGQIFHIMTLENLYRADKIIFEVNARTPMVGGECALPVSMADVIYEVDEPIFQLSDPPIGETEKTIAQNDNVVSVNASLQIDLTGQVCAESIGPRQHSGTGGASDFAYGAYHSKVGRAILAQSSTTKKGTLSRIVPTLDTGAIVSVSRNLTDGEKRINICIIEKKTCRNFRCPHKIGLP